MSEQAIILYDDGDWSEGHYQSIFGLYVKACLQNGMRVSAACPQPEVIRSWIAERCPELSDLCTFHQTAGSQLKKKYRRLKPLTRAAWWARAGQTARRIRRLDGHSGSMFFMNVNHLRGALWTDRLADLLMPCPWSAFIYDSSSVRRGSVDLQLLQRQFNFLTAKQCKAFGVTDEKMVAPMQEAFPDVHILFLPDTTPEETAETSPLAGEILQQANGRKIVGLLGMLHKRKGLLTALKLAEARPDLFFVFAGAMDLNKMSTEEQTFVTELISRQPENCFFHLQRIEEEAEFNALVKIVDLVYAVYPGFTNSSGLLTKAGLFGKPCLVAAGDTCMADRVEKYHIGLAAPSDDIAACAAATDQLLSGEERNDTVFRNDFSEEALQSALARLLTS